MKGTTFPVKMMENGELTAAEKFGRIHHHKEKEKRMNPKYLENEVRPIVWRVSETDPSTYCIYLYGRLVWENLGVESFLSTYKALHNVARYGTLNDIAKAI